LYVGIQSQIGQLIIGDKLLCTSKPNKKRGERGEKKGERRKRKRKKRGGRREGEWKIRYC
jgi:hypothetical protein